MQLNVDAAWHLMLMARLCRKVWQHAHKHTLVHNLWGVKSSKHWSDPRLLANERGSRGPSLISWRDNGSNWHQAETFQSLASASRQTKGVTLLWSPRLVLTAPLLLRPLRRFIRDGSPFRSVPSFWVQRVRQRWAQSKDPIQSIQDMDGIDSFFVFVCKTAVNHKVC